MGETVSGSSCGNGSVESNEVRGRRAAETRCAVQDELRGNDMKSTHLLDVARYALQSIQTLLYGGIETLRELDMNTKMTLKLFWGLQR